MFATAELADILFDALIDRPMRLCSPLNVSRRAGRASSNHRLPLTPHHGRRRRYRFSHAAAPACRWRGPSDLFRHLWSGRACRDRHYFHMGPAIKQKSRPLSFARERCRLRAWTFSPCLFCELSCLSPECWSVTGLDRLYPRFDVIGCGKIKTNDFARESLTQLIPAKGRRRRLLNPERTNR